MPEKEEPEVSDWAKGWCKSVPKEFAVNVRECRILFEQEAKQGQSKSETSKKTETETETKKES